MARYFAAIGIGAVCGVALLVVVSLIVVEIADGRLAGF